MTGDSRSSQKHKRHNTKIVATECYCQQKTSETNFIALSFSNKKVRYVSLLTFYYIIIILLILI